MIEHETPFTKPIYLLISFLTGAVLGVLYALPKLNISLNLITQVFLPSLMIIGLLVISLKNPKNHHQKFVLTLFISNLIGFFTADYLLNLLLNKINVEVVIFVFLLILLYLAQLYALNPKNRSLSNTLIVMICAAVTAFFCIAPIIIPMLYFGVFFMLVVWMIQIFLTPICKRQLILRFVLAGLMIMVCQTNIYLLQKQTFANAQSLVSQVLAYKNTHHDYPTTDMMKPYLKPNINYSYRNFSSRQCSFADTPDYWLTPILTYNEITDPYCRYNFDFDSQKWADECKGS